MQKKVKILIVEDEFITLDNLKEVLEELGYEVPHAVMKAEQAIPILKEQDIDIAILDINLKSGKSGIWLAEQITNEYHIPFIFLSAYSDKKTVREAVATQPASYLVKPFSKASIYTALEVALTNFSGDNREKNDDYIFNNSIFIKDGKTFKKLNLIDIQYIEAFKNYLELHLIEGRHIIRSTLKEFSTKLPDTFLQTNRSFIINKKYVKEVTSTSIKINEVQVPLSKGFREQVLDKLDL